MVYSGKYQVKNKSKYNGDSTNVIYRSLWEKAVFMWCDKNSNVKNWSSESVIVPYYYCLLYTSPSPRDPSISRMPSSA